MMKKILFIALTTFICAAITACGPEPSTAEILSTAEQAIETHHYSTAQKISDELFEHADEKQMTASELGRLSLLFMRLSENGREQENVCQAAQCYLKAFATNADSARAYYSALPLDASCHVEMMASLSHAITSPASVAGNDEWCDSQDSIDINHSHNENR